MLHPASNRKRYSRTAPHPNSINTENPSAITARRSSSRIPASHGSRKNVGVSLSAPTTSRPILFTFLHGTKRCPIPSGVDNAQSEKRGRTALLENRTLPFVVKIKKLFFLHHPFTRLFFHRESGYRQHSQCLANGENHLSVCGFDAIFNISFRIVCRRIRTTQINQTTLVCFLLERPFLQNSRKIFPCTVINTRNIAATFQSTMLFLVKILFPLIHLQHK